MLVADWSYVCDFDHRMDDINLVAEPQRALVRADGVLVFDVHPVKANFAQPQTGRSGVTVRGEADMRPQRLTQAMTQLVRTLRCTIVDSDYIDVDVLRFRLRADIAHLDNGEFGSAALSGRLSAFRRDSGRSA